MTDEEDVPVADRPRVVIVGAGPAGLVLAWLLHHAEVPFVLVERQDRADIGTQPKAGIVEFRTVELLREVGIADVALHFEAENRRVEFRTPRLAHVFDYADLTGDRPHYVFPQHRLVAELAAALVERGAPLRFGQRVREVTTDGARPHVVLEGPGGVRQELAPEVVVGADGASSTVARAVADHVEVLDRNLPARWLVVSTASAPLVDHTVYGIHPRGYAAHLRRGPRETRFYVEVSHDVGADDLTHDEIRAELAERLRLDPDAVAGLDIRSVDVLDLRTRMTTPMQYGGCHLVGDAAHLITPAGGKGMNLAIADAVELAHGLVEAFGPKGDRTRLDAYSDTRIPALWQTQAFSDWFLRILTARSSDVTDDGSAAFVHGLREGWVAALRDDAGLAHRFAHAYAGVDLASP
jgi:p-hydroxybenzoate 3-monooxygenase